MPHSTNRRLLLTLASAAVVALVGCAQPGSPRTSAQSGNTHGHTGTGTPSNTAQTMQRTLQQHSWTLTAIYPVAGSSAQANVSASSEGVQLRFMPPKAGDLSATVLVSGLCNRMHGAYKVQGTDMQVSQLVGTLMACQNNDLMQLERFIGQSLPKAQSWRLPNPEVLEITFSDGQRWVLQGTMHYEAMYGEPQRLFLEVAPQLQDCKHPLMPESQCLQVREVLYDQRGIKTGTGAWKPFYDSIEDYTHQSGMRQVLRLKRYTRQPAQVPADGSRYVYVLDMVVETGPAE